MTPKERAEKSAEALWRDDGASQSFGMQIVEVDEGRATMTMEVQQRHANGHGICHGGVIFSLADSAFAFACNSRNQSTVAHNNSVTYIRPGRLGDRLTAHAREINLSGRTGITDVRVTNQSGETIAEFRGVSRAIAGHVFNEDRP